MAERPEIPLIGLAHGSRHPAVAQSIDALMGAVARSAGIPAVAAYLDLTEPDLNLAVLDLAVQGYRRAVVAPLLFTEAYHAQVDVPRAVADAAKLSGMELTTAQILGTGEDVLGVLELSMAAAGIAESEPVLLVSVGSSDPCANDAVKHLAVRLGRDRSGQVTAAFGTQGPRPVDVLGAMPAPVAIVPLFVSPGLLLDPLARVAAERGLVMAQPLGELLAPLLADRYHEAAIVARS
jgi:sirohydrochlorin ferrochelatase